MLALDGQPREAEVFESGGAVHFRWRKGDAIFDAAVPWRPGV